MSGPKTSHYTLTAEQRRILAQQRLEARRRAALTGRIRALVEKSGRIAVKASEGCAAASEMKKAGMSDGGYTEDLSKLTKIRDRILAVAGQTNGGSLERLESGAKDIEERIKEMSLLSDKLVSLSERNRESLQKELEKRIDAGSAIGFDALDPAQKTKKAFEQRKESLKKRLVEFIESGLLGARLTEEIDAVCESVSRSDSEEGLSSLEIVAVRPLIRKCVSALEERASIEEEFDSTYSAYLELCEQTGNKAEEYEYTAQSLEELKRAYSRLEAVSDAAAERTYIAACLDEVMAEMGYDVIGRREGARRSGVSFRSALFRYGEGTAVSVTCSSDGKVALELGGLDASDRLPDEEETDVLCEEMKRFCCDFEEIEKRLREKGVVLSGRVSMAPPSREYAQIINASDYGVTSVGNTSIARRRNKPKGKARKVD